MRYRVSCKFLIEHVFTVTADSEEQARKKVEGWYPNDELLEPISIEVHEIKEAIKS